MKSLIATVVFVSFSMLGLCQSPLNSKATDILKSLNKDKGMVGLSGAFSIDGKIEWISAQGYANKEAVVAFTPETTTRIASITKPMTAVAIMQLMDSHNLDLDSSIGLLLPEYNNHPYSQITVKQLLGHRSGIGAYKSGKEAETTKEYSDLKSAAKSFDNRELLFNPGESYSYTTYGYVILGRVIEEVSGMTYTEYMQKNVFEKANMTNSGMEDYGTQYVGKSELYSKGKKKSKKAKLNNLSNRLPGGGVYSTIEDIIKFGNAIVDGILVSPDRLKQMSEVEYRREGGNPYGLGWFVYQDEGGEGILIGHSGAQTGVSSQLFIVPKNRTVVAILANTSGGWDDVIKSTGELLQISQEFISENKQD